MNEPTLALITPTLGRPTLAQTLASARNQLREGDEWLVVGDGPRPLAAEMVRRCGDARLRYFERHDSRSTYGNAQRNLAMQQARADLFVFLDDDDELLPGAAAAIRREGRFHVPMMFRMDYVPGRRVLWRDPVLREGNVSGAMFVVPNIPGRWAAWPETDRPCIGDLAFIRATLDLWPRDSLRWCDDVICRCLRHGAGQ